MDKCEKCLNGRIIISENGYHPVCCLSQKAAMKCMMGKKSQFVTLDKDESGNIESRF